MQEEAQTPGDVLVQPISFGQLYAGLSSRNAFFGTLLNGQLPLGFAQVGCLLAMAPRRLSEFDDLKVWCVADSYRYSWGGDTRKREVWERTICFMIARADEIYNTRSRTPIFDFQEIPVQWVRGGAVVALSPRSRLS